MFYVVGRIQDYGLTQRAFGVLLLIKGIQSSAKPIVPPGTFLVEPYRFSCLGLRLGITLEIEKFIREIAVVNGVVGSQLSGLLKAIELVCILILRDP